MAALTSECNQNMASLANDVWPKFVQSKACLPLVEDLVGGTGR